MIDGRRRRSTTTLHQPTEAPATLGQRLGKALVRVGVSADAVTGAGVVLAAACGVAIGLGHLLLGLFLLAGGGLSDFLDGHVAKAAGTSSVRGAFFDSVADRLSDALILGGLTWHLLLGDNPRYALLPVAIMAVGAVISYERAKAESLGLTATGGLMERAERIIVIGLALIFHVVLIPFLFVLLALCIATAAGRFLRVWRLASGTPPRDAGRARMESQWRAWRESGRARARRNARSRRQLEPAATRLRKVLGNNRPAGATTGRQVTGQRLTGRRRAAVAFRERLDGGR